MKENSDEIKTQLESGCVPSYSPMVNIRNVLLEMRDSSDPAVVEFAKKLSDALARDCYCQICGRILKDQPIRNCDVGTTEEQYKRFNKFCFDNMGDGMKESRCSKCPLYGTKSSCKFDWEQMPYEGKGESNEQH